MGKNDNGFWFALAAALATLGLIGIVNGADWFVADIGLLVFGSLIATYFAFV